MVNSSRGRPKGGSDARDRILSAAQRQFLEHGYSGTTLRAIAREAGVDHALVNYHFGSKDRLFGEALGMLATPHSRIAVLDLGLPASELAPRLAVNALRLWREAAFIEPLQQLFHEQPEEATKLLGSYVHEQVYDVFASGLTGRRAELRAARVTAVMVGLFFGRHFARIEPLASMSDEDVLRMVVPLLVAALDDRRK